MAWSKPFHGNVARRAGTTIDLLCLARKSLLEECIVYISSLCVIQPVHIHLEPHIACTYPSGTSYSLYISTWNLI